MGFRNPVTSATAVDTRTGTAAPGVRMYEQPIDPSTPRPRGVVEWDDGYTGDTPATLTQTADNNPRAITTPLGSMTLDAGSYGGTQGPKMAWNVEQALDGISPPVVVTRLTSAGGMTLNGQQVATGVGDWVYDVENSSYSSGALPTGWSNLFTASVTVPAGMVLEVEFKAPRVTIAPNGETRVQLLLGGSVYDLSDFSTGGGASLYTPANLSGSLVGTGAAVAIAVQGSSPVGGGTVQSAGGFVRLRHRIRG